jgi:imidazoleglycerol-phosphate dehydratase
MLSVFARHGLLDLEVRAKGDVEIDPHHTVEDVAIVVGEAIKRALGDKKGIRRFGTAAVPLDEALSRATVDLSGRGLFEMHGAFPREKTGDFDCVLGEDFFRAFATNAGATLHLELVSGRNAHHILETAFKAVAVALRDAVVRDSRVEGVPSTKGVL